MPRIFAGVKNYSQLLLIIWICFFLPKFHEGENPLFVKVMFKDIPRYVLNMKYINFVFLHLGP
jgi:hypothetical protein